MKVKFLIAELRRRNVFKAAIGYLVVAWIIAQVAAVVFPAFNAPSNLMKVLIILLILGFPIILILAWALKFPFLGKQNNEEPDSYALSDDEAGNSRAKKLAVIPFVNISSEPNSDYFSDGLTEEIIIRLSQVDELEIASRYTSMRYKNSDLSISALGKKLNARYVLHGTVRKLIDNLKISIELIDVVTDSELWAEIYSGKMTDIFTIQENVSKKIVGSLQLKLSPKEKEAITRRSTRSSEAFDAYLQARDLVYRYTKRHLILAIDLFEDAIQKDPEYAAAYAGMGEACALLYETHDKSPEWLEKAENSALKGLIYNPNSSEAYGALGLVYYNKDMLDEALRSVEKAISFDNDNFFAYWIRGRLYRIMDKDEKAVVDYLKALDLKKDFHSVFGDLQMAYEKLGDKENLLKIVDQALLFYPSYLSRNPDDARAHQFYAFTLKRSDRLEQAKEEMEIALSLSSKDLIISYNLACFYALLGDKKAAIDCLRTTIGNGFRNFEYIKHDPDFSSLRNDDSFKALFLEDS